MALISFNFSSQVLGKVCKANVIISKAISDEYSRNGANGKKYPVLFLLHGLTGDHTSYIRRSSIEIYAEEHNLIVAMPDGDRSFYTNTYAGAKYWTFISEEFPNIIAGLFPVSTKREDTFVAGISMGGYGALKVALNNPERFASCTFLSAVTQSYEIFDILNKAEGDSIFGPERMVPEYCQIAKLIEKCAQLPKEKRPKLIQFCGTEDFLYKGNCLTRDLIQKTGAFEYIYEESKGAHNWDFWTDYLKKTIELLPLNERAL